MPSSDTICRSAVHSGVRENTGFLKKKREDVQFLVYKYNFCIISNYSE